MTDSYRPFFGLLVLLAIAMALTGCTVVPELGELTDRGGTSGRRIVVDLSAQQAYLYHRGRLTAASPISSGREGKRTPTGRFQIIEKDIDHLSSLYGDFVRDGRVVKANVDVRTARRPPGSRFVGTSMPYFMRFSGAHGLHAGNLPGHPASAGCIRLPYRQARRFYKAVRVGTPVTVTR